MKVLLVRLSSMGDLIHTLPAISDLAAHRPDIQLDWLCEAAFSDIARLHPFVQNVYEMKWLPETHFAASRVYAYFG